VGRHTAADGASRDPLVAAALAHRPADAPSAHRDGASAGESGLGWPGPPPGPDRGLGWPGDLATDDSGAGNDVTASAEEPAGRPVRRVWRRFFGLDPAA
jgi:hypothetical protein